MTFWTDQSYVNGPNTIKATEQERKKERKKKRRKKKEERKKKEGKGRKEQESAEAIQRTKKGKEANEAELMMGEWQ